MNNYWKAVLSCVAGCTLGLVNPVAAVDSSWINAGSGLWEVPSNWSGGAPTNTFGTLWITNANTKTVSLYSPLPSGTLTISNLTISGTGSTTNTLAVGMSGGMINGPFVIRNTLLVDSGGVFVQGVGTTRVEGVSVGGFEVNGSAQINGGTFVTTNTGSYIGWNDDGQMSVSNAEWLAGTIHVGANIGSRGTLTFSSGTIDCRSGLIAVGHNQNTTGTVWQTGGTLITTNVSSYIGNGGVGRMTVSNGTWQAFSVQVGYNSGGRGTLTLAGGVTTLASELKVGSQANSTGAVWLTGGQLTVTNTEVSTVIGSSGVGTMTVSNGTWLARDVVVGENIGSRGTLTFAGGNSTMQNLTAGDNGTGTIWITGGQVDTGFFGTFVGFGAPNEQASGKIIVSNGTFVTPTVSLGVYAQGTLTVAGGVTEIKNYYTALQIGTYGTGTVLVTGGQLFVTNGTTQVQQGQLTISGGATHLRHVAVDPTGTFTISGGSLRLAGSMAVGSGAGGGHGNFYGGNIVIEPTASLQLGTDITYVNSVITNQGILQTLAPSVAFNILVNQSTYNINGGQIITVGDLDNTAAANLYINLGGVLNVNLSWLNAGGVEFSQGGVLRGGDVQNTGLMEGSGRIDASLYNTAGGTVRAANGLLQLNGTIVQNQAGGYFEAVPGGTLRIGKSMGNFGVFNPQGGVIDCQTNTLNNQGTLTGFGTYKAKEIINNGRAIFQGGQVNFQSTYINNAGRTTEVALASASFFGPVTNNAGAVFKNTASQITFFSTFFNNGTYISDPATNTFNAALALGPAGKLAGGEGDVFIVNADLLSANPNGLDIADATLAFGGGTHNFTLAGTARIGTLSVADGATVVLNGGDLIVGFFGADASQFTTAQTIYYEPALNPDLDGQTYALTGGGSLTVVPEPSTCVLVLLGGVTALAVARRRTCKTLALR